MILSGTFSKVDILAYLDHTVNIGDYIGNDLRPHICRKQAEANDTEEPVITCPADIDATPDQGMSTSSMTWGLPNATDNAGNVTATGSHDPGDDFGIGISVVQYTAVDTSGNIGTCQFTVTITDTEEPVITCPADIDATPDQGMSTASMTWGVPNATDNAGNVTVTGSHDPGDDFGIGISVVQYTAVDTSGNIGTCQFTVTITDTEEPVVTCPADIDATTDKGLPTTSITWAIPNATDNAGDVTVAGSRDPGDAFDIGIAVVTYTAVDPSGNKVECQFSVNVTGDC
ncbi:hyalin-like [Glandiceps talaboti]